MVGKPKAQEKRRDVRLAVRVTSALSERIAACAEHDQRTVSSWIEVALVAAVNAAEAARGVAVAPEPAAEPTKKKRSR